MPLRSWDEVYEKMGGPAEVGRAIGTTTEHASGMLRRGRIPSPYWMDLERDACVRRITEITYEALAELDAFVAHSRREENLVAGGAER